MICILFLSCTTRNYKNRKRLTPFDITMQSLYTPRPRKTTTNVKWSQYRGHANKYYYFIGVTVPMVVRGFNGFLVEILLAIVVPLSCGNFKVPLWQVSIHMSISSQVYSFFFITADKRKLLETPVII